MGVEPTSLAWEARVMPLYDTRILLAIIVGSVPVSWFVVSTGRIRCVDRLAHLTYCIY